MQARLAFQKARFGDEIRFGNKLERALDQAKDTLIHKNYVSSQLHKEVATALKTLVNFEVEKFVDFISCDILLDQDKTVFEINGPSHYLHNSNMLDGATLLKLRLLQKLGYSIIVVPYWEWNQLDTDEEKKHYLKARLGQIVSSKTPVTSLSLEDGIVEL